MDLQIMNYKKKLTFNFGATMAYGEKTGGREQGTPNKVTKELRIMIKELLDNEMENIQSRLDTLNNKDRLELLVKLMAFVMPKYQEVKQDVRMEGYQTTMQPLIRVEGIPKSLLYSIDKDKEELDKERLAFLQEKQEFEKLRN